MPRRDLDRLHSQTFPRHPSLPLGPDRPVVCGHDVGRRDLRREPKSLAVDAEGQEEPAGRERPLEHRVVTIVVQERRGDGVVLGRVLPDPVGIEGGLRPEAGVLDEARLGVRNPGREPDLVASLQRACGGREQRTRAGVREDDRRGDSADLSADELGVVGGQKIGGAGQLDRVCRLPALGEGMHDALPAGGALPRAVDQDDVAHRGVGVG
jgi:hypothetical protein